MGVPRNIPRKQFIVYEPEHANGDGMVASSLLYRSARTRKWREKHDLPNGFWTSIRIQGQPQVGAFVQTLDGWVLIWPRSYLRPQDFGEIYRQLGGDVDLDHVLAVLYFARPNTLWSIKKLKVGQVDMVEGLLSATN